jgi:hypothetical protein
MTDIDDTRAVPRAAAKGLVSAQPSSAASTRPGKCVYNGYEGVGVTRKAWHQERVAIGSDLEGDS